MIRPSANDDTVEVTQDSSVAVAVLANDTDVDGATLTPANFAQPQPARCDGVANPDGTVDLHAARQLRRTRVVHLQGQRRRGHDSNTATVHLTVFPVICSNETVTDSDAGVTGSFTRLDDTFNCKRYTLDASSANGTVLFQPSGAAAVDYRGYVSFGSTAAPVGPFPLLLGVRPQRRQQLPTRQVVREPAIRRQRQRHDRHDSGG